MSNYIIVTPMSGNSDGTVTINVGTNYSQFARKAKVRAVCTTNPSLYSEVELLQRAYPTLEVAPSAFNLSKSDVNEKIISVVSNTDWTASSDSQWIELTRWQGEGDGTVRFVCDENEGYADRSAVIRIQTVEGMVHDVTVRQESAAASISVVPEIKEISYERTATSIQVTSDSPYRIEADSGITISRDTGTAGVTNHIVIVDENDSDSARTMDIRFYGSGSSVVAATVSIVQSEAPLEYITVEPNVFNIAADDTSLKSIRIESNASWTAYTEDVDWITMVSATGHGDGEATFRVRPNSGDERGEYIRVETEGGIYEDVDVFQSRFSAEIEVDVEYAEFDSDGWNGTINVSSNVEWTAETDEWVRLSAYSGSGQTEISVVCGIGDDYVSRTSEINFMFESEVIASVGIRQYPKNASVPFYIENTGSTVSFNFKNAQDFSYSYDAVQWRTGTTVQIASGQKAYIRMSNAHLETNNVSGARVNVGGNVYSLLYGSEFTNQTEFSDSSENFSGLFSPNNPELVDNISRNIVSAEKLMLPASVLTTNAYADMFSGCWYMTKAPSVLPADSMSENCYARMFYGCGYLVSAPSILAHSAGKHSCESMFGYCTRLKSMANLPATELDDYCYASMFEECTSLTTAPSLPATTLASHCYQYMFSDCTALKTSPELPSSSLSSYCYTGMFKGCTSLTTAPELPATVLSDSCYLKMFNGCTSLRTAPQLNAGVLEEHSYTEMFKQCSSLNYIKCIATDISAYACTLNWVSGVSATGTFVKDANTTWYRGTSDIPEGWTVVDA